MRSVNRAILRKLLYSLFAILLVTNLLMTSWTVSLAQAMNSSAGSRMMTFQDADIPYVSGVVELSAFTLLYESTSTSVWFNITMNFASSVPINVTLDEITVHEASSTGEFPSNYTTIGAIHNPLKFVNISQFSFSGYILTHPILMVGNITYGLSIHYWVCTANQTLNNVWWNLFLLQVHILPSILRPDGWMYANASTLIIGVILIVHYIAKRIQIV